MGPANSPPPDGNADLSAEDAKTIIKRSIPRTRGQFPMMLTDDPRDGQGLGPEIATDEVTPGEQKNERIRTRYQDIMIPIFFPEEPTKPDIKLLFSSVLRVMGMEDKGWDPHAESRAVIDDLYAFMQMELPGERFSDPELTKWRVGLMFYSHIVEMSAPYEVLANLIRYRLGKGYHPNPFFDFLTKDEKKRVKKIGISTKQKIRVVRELSDAAGFQLASVIDEFYNPAFRNAIAHSDFTFTDEGFRCRGAVFDAFTLTFEQVDDLITSAKLFIGVFFQLDREFRIIWGAQANRAMAYDPVYKGVMEILANEDGRLEGYKVHWPNGTDSFYRRTDSGIDMTNMLLALKEGDIELFVGLYARRPDAFSPLVEHGEPARYTPLSNGQPVTWKP